MYKLYNSSYEDLEEKIIKTKQVYFYLDLISTQKCDYQNSHFF